MKNERVGVVNHCFSHFYFHNHIGVVRQLQVEGSNEKGEGLDIGIPDGIHHWDDAPVLVAGVTMMEVRKSTVMKELAILEYLADGVPRTIKEIEAETGFPHSTTHEFLIRLEKSGKVTRSNRYQSHSCKGCVSCGETKRYSVKCTDPLYKGKKLGGWKSDNNGHQCKGFIPNTDLEFKKFRGRIPMLWRIVEDETEG